MPAAVSYPGVYIEEIPSGVRTITGVGTSITAFLGKAVRGPVNQPVTLTGFGDFERIFGGLAATMTLGYAVRDFFANGGSQAVVVRLYKTPPGATAKATFEATDLKLEASSEGDWANRMRFRVDQRPASDPNLIAVAERLGVQPADLFDLTVRDPDGRLESFLNLTTKESARRADRVLKAESTLVTVATSLPATTTPGAHSGSPADADVWTDDAKSAKASANGNASAALGDGDFTGSPSAKTGLYALEHVDLFNLLVITADTRGGDVSDTVYGEALDYCVKRRATLLVDPKTSWTDVDKAVKGMSATTLTGTRARNAAVYFPRLLQPDPLLNGLVDSFAPSGAVAGVLARTDAQRGVWKAPAGTDATLNGAAGLQLNLTDGENGLLNPLGLNVLRTLPVFGRVVWGARTMRGADAAADEYKYLPVRRTALYLEESLFRGLKWVVFEPNDEPLWAQIRLNVGAFLHNLFRQGAFQGRTPREAYLVKCDRETTTQNDIDLGVVNVLVGFAPLKPAEFVIIRMQQLAGQIQA
ncbi:phage tail sheath subtilisin-like domain-containing protein [Acrocarpospora macrocephala]|uniref:Tail protein n=1 Tax=Acrocarpospora macrocephala TaxID=150177 RepID=A0A5M3WRD3_9ACTN|nr:phage tail sheath C-terminal domain-containing protein [Acrocarpospora macrocephala]GES11927.1 tail protein [Acrocarpospora macrocephala]